MFYIWLRQESVLFSSGNLSPAIQVSNNCGLRKSGCSWGNCGCRIDGEGVRGGGGVGVGGLG